MKNKDTSANKVAIVTGSATGIGYEIVDVEELRRKSSDEELCQIVGQNIAKKEEQVKYASKTRWRRGCFDLGRVCIHGRLASSPDKIRHRAMDDGFVQLGSMGQTRSIGHRQPDYPGKAKTGGGAGQGRRIRLAGARHRKGESARQQFAVRSCHDRHRQQ